MEWLAMYEPHGILNIASNHCLQTCIEKVGFLNWAHPAFGMSWDLTYTLIKYNLPEQ